MKKKMTALLVFAVMATSILGGCGNKNQEGADGKTKIRFASWNDAGDLEREQKFVDQFNASQDKIEVTMEAYGKDYDTKISAGMGAADTPDVMYMWDYPSYYKGLEPLEPYIEKEGAEYKDNFYEALWPYNQMKETTYGIPVGFTTHVLYYNKDIFASAGVAEPTNDWTWDDLRAAAKTITEKSDGVKGFVFSMKPDPYDGEMYLWSNGTAYGDAAGAMDGYLNSDKAVEAIGFFQELYKDGSAVVSEEDGAEEFRAGKAAMHIYGAWALNNLDEDGVNYGVVDIPAFKNAGRDSVSILSSSGVSISKDSKNKEAAWEFVKYWTGEEMNKARIGYELPTLKSVAASEGVLDKPVNKPFYHMLEQSEGFTPISFIVDNWSTVKDGLSLAYEKIYNPSTLEDPKTVLDEMAK